MQQGCAIVHRHCIWLSGKVHCGSTRVEPGIWRSPSLWVLRPVAWSQGRRTLGMGAQLWARTPSVKDWFLIKGESPQAHDFSNPFGNGGGEVSSKKNMSHCMPWTWRAYWIFSSLPLKCITAGDTPNNTEKWSPDKNQDMACPSPHRPRLVLELSHLHGLDTWWRNPWKHSRRSPATDGHQSLQW